MKYLIILFLGISLLSCNNTSTKKEENKTENSKELIYSKLFEIREFENYTELRVLSEDANKSSIFYLVNKDIEIPKILKDKQIIRTPVERVICLSTTHIAFIDLLEETSKIVGIAGVNNVYNKKILQAVTDKTIFDVGYDQSLDYERIIRLKPDLVTIFDLNGSSTPALNKLKALKIPVVVINEYSEQSILGQTEWLKFFAEFFEKSTFAENIVDSISSNYNNYKNLANKATTQPSVLLNMPWKGVWYMPGKNSNVAQLISDAGGNYSWKNFGDLRNYPTDIANVFVKSNNSEFWLNSGQAINYKDIAIVDKRLTKFASFKNKKIFNRNKRLSAAGGNDYMESGVIHPDIILLDIIKILHPELGLGNDLFYYRKLK